jgi:RNA recognition motif-containing protein
MSESVDRTEKKRKLQDGPELEIDVSAPEPQSKKALRQAKKSKTSESSKDTEDASSGKTESKSKSKSTAEPAKRSPWGIWVGNMVFSTTENELVEHLLKFSGLEKSTITRVNMSKGPEKFGRLQNKGFAYIDFSTKEAQDTLRGSARQGCHRCFRQR